MNARALLLLGLSALACLSVVLVLRAAGRDDASVEPVSDPAAPRAQGSGWIGALDGVAGRVMHPGPLSEAHVHLEGLTACDACHGDRDDVPDARCLACHEEIGVRTRERVPLHGRFQGDCRACHPEHGGEERPLLVLDRDGFQHEQTRFALRGAHLEVECEACHELGVVGGGVAFHFQGVPHQACSACHVDPHAGGERQLVHAPLLRVALDAPVDPAARALDPEHPIAGHDCADCHGEGSFRASGLRAGGFSHAEHTAFALEGVHAGVACDACHEPRLRVLELERGLPPGSAAEPGCASCHEDPHRGALTRADGCGHCHQPTSWSTGFDHDRNTRFALDALHGELTCRSCHDDARYRSAGTECSSCHVDAAQLLAGRFGAHEISPDVHAEGVDCLDCHGRSRAENTLSAIARSCVQCHDPAYAALVATWQARLDERAIAAAHDGTRELVERLRRSGSHHFELASELLRSMGADRPAQP